MSWTSTAMRNTIMDAACFSPHLRDARLQTGWTFMDLDYKIAVKVQSVDLHSTPPTATVAFWKAPTDTASIIALRGASNFTDGWFTCPVNTCTNAKKMEDCDNELLSCDSTHWINHQNVSTYWCPNTCEGGCEAYKALPSALGSNR